MKNFTKIFAFILLVFLFISVFCSCNRTIFDTQYTFNYAYITIGDKTIEGSVSSWCDYDDSDMVQIILTDDTVYYTHSTNIVLIKRD